MRKKKTMVPHKRQKPLMETHHRFPTAQGGRHWSPERNQVRVTQSQHRAWHTLFDGKCTPEDIATIINSVWIDPRYVLVLRRRK